MVMSEAGKTERQQQDEASASATPVSKHTRKGHRPSLLDIEAMEDISDIRPSKNEWTSEECVRILQPFMKLPPAKWPVASERIRFFEMAAVPSDATTAVRDFVVEREPPSEPGPLQAYNEKYRDCSCLLRSHETLYPLEVAEQLRPLADKRVQDWSKAEIGVAVALLKGAPSVDFAKKQGVATVKDGEDVWTRFVDKWEVFLAENPRVKREVDPFLVIIDVFGATPAMVADVNAARAAYPPGGRGPSSPLPPLSASLNGRDFIFPFQDRQHAQHFIGWMQGRIGGLRCWLTRGSLAVNPDYV